MKPLLVVSGMWVIGGCVGRDLTEDEVASATGETSTTVQNGDTTPSEENSDGSASDPTGIIDPTFIENDYAGLTPSDEQPMFDEADIYEAIEEDSEDPAANYPNPEGGYPNPEGAYPDPDVAYPDPDKFVYDVVVLWGQLQFNPMVDPVNWNGRLSVTEGRMHVLRTIRFEDRDHLIPCEAEDHVEFRSHTRPHHDGLHLRMVVPVGSNAALSMDTEAYSCEFPLEEGVTVREIDNQGNRVAVAIFRADPAVCARGLVGGAWHGLDDSGMGLFRGRWSGRGGELEGHLRGVYGTRVALDETGAWSTENVFFGKVINTDGTFRALLAGHYGAGEFHGRWLGRNFEHKGALHGRYIETIPGDEMGGFFLGTWRKYCPGEGPSADDPIVQ